MLRAALVVTLLVAVAGSAGATCTTSATPVYHGTLAVRPARGRVDRSTYIGTLSVQQWLFSPYDGSNGICIGEEPIVISMGPIDDAWRLEPGMLKASKNGKTWTYRLKGKPPVRALKRLKIRLEADGSYMLSFTVSGVDMSAINSQLPACLPFAFIVGDDDGFSGVNLTSKNFSTPRVSISEPCVPNDWPWASGG